MELCFAANFVLTLLRTGLFCSHHCRCYSSFAQLLSRITSCQSILANQLPAGLFSARFCSGPPHPHTPPRLPLEPLKAAHPELAVAGTATKEKTRQSPQKATAGVPPSHTKRWRPPTQLRHPPSLASTPLPTTSPPTWLPPASLAAPSLWPLKTSSLASQEPTRPIPTLTRLTWYVCR